MATETVSADLTKAGHFGLTSSTLKISAAVTLEERCTDALCLIGSSVAIIEKMIERAEDESLWGALYLLRQAVYVLHGEESAA